MTASLGRRAGERPLEDREGDERRAEELRVDRRLRQRAGRRSRRARPTSRRAGRRASDAFETASIRSTSAWVSRERTHRAAILSRSGGDPVSTGSVLRKSCKPRSPVGLVKQPGTK